MGRRFRRRYIRRRSNMHRVVRAVAAGTKSLGKRRYTSAGYFNQDLTTLTIVAGVLCVLCLPVGIVLALIALILWLQEKKREKEYEESAYYLITKLPYRAVCADVGRMGEYLIYQNLQYYENEGARFLFNVYVPKENGETTEIDVLMICSKGIFVFESKNYSGWIFGSETQKTWHQTLPAGRRKSHKESFYNPIMQNRGHMKHLKTLVGERVPMRSVIVFSDRCTLKNVQLTTGEVRVINMRDVPYVVRVWNSPEGTLSDQDIWRIYSALYPYTQMSEEAKRQHIANIQNNLNQTAAQQPQPTYTPVPRTEIPKTDMAAQGVAAVCVAINVMDAVQQPEPEQQCEAPAQKSEMLKCPWCGGNLVLRKASRGANAGNSFYGCSNYPKCKYVRNLSK